MKRSPSATLAILVVVVLAGVLATTSHTSVWSPVRPGVADPVTLLAIVASASGVCLAIAAAIRLIPHPAARQPFSGTLPLVAVATVLLSLFLISKTDLRYGTMAGAAGAETGPTRPGDRLGSDWRGPAVRRGGREDEPEAVIARSDVVVMVRRVLVILGLTALAALLFARRSMRRSAVGGAHTPIGPVGRVAAHDAVVQTIAAMLQDADPRTAIIGAYARLLEELDANGAPRRAYEGPTEHLVRVLGTLDAPPAALKTLVRLFEIARFSDHSLTADHRSRALAALRDVATALGAPSPTPTAHGSTS